MEFMALIAALLLRGLLGALPGRRHDGWFYCYREKVTGKGKSARHLYDTDDPLADKNEPEDKNRLDDKENHRFIWTVFPPVILLGMALWLLEPVLWGVPAFVLSVLVLLYSLGRKESAHWVTRFQIAWRQRDLQGAFQYASEVLPDQKIDNEQQLFHSVFSRLAQIRFHDLFLVMFWFMLLGAEGALLVRLTLLFCESAPASAAAPGSASFSARQWRHLMEWPVLRLQGIALMLTGHFAPCWSVWTGSLLTLRMPHDVLLSRLTWAALGVKEVQGIKEVQGVKDRAQPEMSRGASGDEGTPPRAVADDLCQEEYLEALDGLLSRSAIIWVIVISVGVTLL